MDPSSNDHIFSSDISVDIQPQPAENITYMDVALYEAAGRGEIEEFNKYQESELVSLLTPDHNTVLHVYLATHDHYDDLFGFAFQSLVIETMVFILMRIIFYESHGDLVRIEKRRSTSNFVEQILNKCPSLLLQPNAKGETPLHIAARYGHSDLVEFLINYDQAKAPHIDGDLEKQEARRDMLRNTDLESNTALHIAVEYGHLKVVQALLQFEDPDFSYSPHKSHETPLYIAARREDHCLVDEILDKFKSTTACGLGGPHGRTVLHAAAMAGDASATRIILQKKGDLTKEMDENGHTPLHYAAHLGRYSAVKELLEKDKSAAYIADKKSGMTALLMAARQGHENIEQIVKLLENLVNEEVAEEPVRPIGDLWYTTTGSDSSDEKARVDPQLVVATLIATVTFAAAIAVPSGYKSENGKDQGTPYLIRDVAFKSFVITNALAFTLSLAAVGVHFETSLAFRPTKSKISFELAAGYISYAIIAVVIAFSTAALSW
ncbi:hypothetical protein REPUB_Repub15cG0052500 [Reevesia pubescens]